MLPEGPAQSSDSQRGSGRLPALQPSQEPQFSPRGAGGKRTARRAQHLRVSGEQLEGLAQNLQSLEQQLDSLPQPGALYCVTALLSDHTGKLQTRAGRSQGMLGQTHLGHAGLLLHS